MLETIWFEYYAKSSASCHTGSGKVELGSFEMSQKQTVMLEMVMLSKRLLSGGVENSRTGAFSLIIRSQTKNWSDRVALLEKENIPGWNFLTESHMLCTNEKDFMTHNDW